MAGDSAEKTGTSGMTLQAAAAEAWPAPASQAAADAWPAPASQVDFAWPAVPDGQIPMPWPEAGTAWAAFACDETSSGYFPAAASRKDAQSMEWHSLANPAATPDDSKARWFDDLEFAQAAAFSDSAWCTAPHGRRIESRADHVARLEGRLRQLRAVPERNAQVRASDFSNRSISRTESRRATSTCTHPSLSSASLWIPSTASHDEKQPFLDL
eukprot:TRINITY_DN113234_c0_g1_i1.p1 TRINITY_DN113234_c0_g1~~TRINITY_DN113234_c0_g1_i1.p1  ORF type:complete len:225 (+),score=29.70 TRINITY_DN113234_c0_g1_i1:37-675(+)